MGGLAFSLTVVPHRHRQRVSLLHRLGNEVVRFADIRKTFHVREANAL